MARSVIEVPVEFWERAAANNNSSSWQASSKCSRLIRIWTICPRYWEERRSTRVSHTFRERRSSRAYTVSNE